MADEVVLDPEVDPEYHLKYDTIDMTREDYDRLKVRVVIPPATPHFNINRLITSFPGDSREERRARLWDKLMGFADGDPIVAQSLLYKWSFWARDNQMVPFGEWTFWLLLAGRGFGKTRTGAEWVNELVMQGQAKRIHLVAPTAADVRKTMVEGESGILAISPPWNQPHFEPSKLQLTWPNGAIAQMFSAEEPERLRGPQCDYFWADELCAWKHQQDTWDMLMFGFRLGRTPQGCITTTPKPQPLLKELIAGDPEFNLKADGSTKVVKGSTYDNKGNLTKVFFTKVVRKYEDTRLGRQELHAEVLEDMPGALWNRADIDRTRIPCNIPPILPFVETCKDTGDVKFTAISGGWELLKHRASEILKAVGEDLSRVVVAVDPNASNDEGSDEIGITVVGKGVSGRGYVLADLSMRGSPNEWASTAVLACDLFTADRIIGEANQGGNMVGHTIASAAKFLKRQTPPLRASDHVAITLVHATRGKVTRAEPVSALYEQKLISHVGGMATLEDQMCLFTSDFDRKAMGFSPDRVDSVVWGFTHLFLEANDTGVMEFYQLQVMAKTAAERAKKDPAGRTKMKGPPGVLQAYAQDGTRYDVDEEGFIFVTKENVRGLRSAGFVETA